MKTIKAKRDSEERKRKQIKTLISQLIQQLKIIVKVQELNWSYILKHHLEIYKVLKVN